MRAARKAVAKIVLKIQKAFPKDIDKLHEASPYSRLIAQLTQKQEIQQYTAHFRHRLDFEARLRRIGGPDFVRLKGVTYCMNKYGRYTSLRESCLDANWLSSRLRFSLEIINELFLQSKDIYLTEHGTAYHHFLAKKPYLKVTASLFSPTHALHQDMTELTYPDESFDLCLSFENLEHIPEYKKAIRELFRVTRTGGAVLLSTPFHVDKDTTTVRATIDSMGEITHLLEPEYHGDPLRGEGILSFYDFGWDLLEEFRQAGFASVNLVVGHDTSKLILDRQLFISAIK